MPKVFIVEPVRSNLNFQSAEQFGETVYLFNEGDRRSSVFDSENYADDIAEALSRKEFNPNKDYICITGSIIPVTLVVATMIHLYGRVNALFFRANESSYSSHWIGENSNARNNKSIQKGERVTHGDLLRDSTDTDGA